MKVELRTSEAARREYAVQTGRTVLAKAVYDLDLAEFTVQERALLVEAFGVQGSDLYPCKPLEYDYTFDASVVPQDHDTWLTAARDVQAFRMQVVAEREAHAVAEKAREEASLARTLATRTAQVAEWDQELQSFEAMTPDELADALEGTAQLPFLDRGWIGEFAPELLTRKQALRDRVRPIQEARVAARKSAAEAELQTQEAERTTWITEHGSDFLRRAIAAGYNCQKRYVVERAALEHPEATLDYTGNAGWKSRSCPSGTALDLAEKVGGRVVWLTSPARTDKVDQEEEFYDETFEEHEAVVLRGYLGKYDLVYQNF